MKRDSKLKKTKLNYKYDEIAFISYIVYRNRSQLCSYELICFYYDDYNNDNRIDYKLFIIYYYDNEVVDKVKVRTSVRSEM